MKKVIRLTENDLRRIVLRVIREQEEMDQEEFDFEMDQEEDENDDRDMGKKMDDVEVLADFFSEKLNELPARVYDKLVDKVESMDMDSDEVLRESDEEYSDLDRRKDRRKGKALQLGAAAAGVPALMGFIAQIPGWIDFSSLTKVHELFEMLNLGNYTGPVMGSVIVAAIIAALRGEVFKDQAREGKRF